MKKYFLLIPTIVFPYCVLFSMYCIYSGCFMESLFQNSVFSLAGGQGYIKKRRSSYGSRERPNPQFLDRGYWKA